MKRRVWLLQMVDIEMNSAGDMEPVDEPRVLACTYLPSVADKMLGIVKDAERKDAINNMVRSEIEVLPSTIQAVLDTAEPSSILDEMLADIDKSN